MTARLHRAGPCWLVDNDPWESPHFDTEPEAVADADREWLADAEADDSRDRGPAKVLREPHPCWLVTCDHPGCDEQDEGDYEMGAIHHVSAAPPVLTEGAKPGEWLCPEHAPEPEWLRRINADLKEAGL